ncbi:MAG: TRAP transporter large permease [Variovorax sp.]
MSAIAWTLGLLPLLLLVLGFPIFLVLLASVTAAITLALHLPLVVLHQNLFGGVDSYALLAVPFFIYAGELMGRGSVAQRLVDFVEAGVGSVRGGLGVTTVGTSAIFGAISGSSAAGVATIGRVMMPALKAGGYPERFSAGLITAVGAIDVIIPPSIPMIVYGSAAQESVPRLYAAGVLPGLLIALLLASYVMWFARRHGIGVGSAFDLSRLARSTWRGAWALGAPVVVLGGIYGGVFSPTEAAAVASVYAAVVTRFVYRELSFADIFAAAATTVRFTAQVLIIVACASVFAWLLTTNQVPAALVAAMKAADVAPWILLLSINVLLLIVGCFVDPLSAILLLSPLLVPLVKAAGIDGVHFGIVVMVNLAIGLFTPPFGMNIFVAQSVLKMPIQTIYRGIVPFFFLYLVALGLITYIPAISLGSMRLLMGN